MSQPYLKPLARAERITALTGPQARALHPLLEALLFRHADVLSEGDIRSLPGGHEAYFGSTMIRLDLAPVGRHWRGAFDAQAKEQLRRIVEGSVRCHLRANRIACNEVARRVPGRRLGTAQIETSARIVGHHLHIDVDLEVPLGLASRARTR